MVQLTGMDRPSITRPLVATQRTTLMSGSKPQIICGAMGMTRLSTLELVRTLGKLSLKAERSIIKDLWLSDTFTVRTDTTKRIMRTTHMRLSCQTKLLIHESGWPIRATHGLSQWTSMAGLRPGPMESIVHISRELRMIAPESKSSDCLKVCTLNTCHITIDGLLVSIRMVVSGSFNLIGSSGIMSRRTMIKMVSMCGLWKLEM